MYRSCTPTSAGRLGLIIWPLSEAGVSAFHRLLVRFMFLLSPNLNPPLSNRIIPRKQHRRLTEGFLDSSLPLSSMEHTSPFLFILDVGTSGTINPRSFVGELSAYILSGPPCKPSRLIPQTPLLRRRLDICRISTNFVFSTLPEDLPTSSQLVSSFKPSPSPRMPDLWTTSSSVHRGC